MTMLPRKQHVPVFALLLANVLAWHIPDSTNANRNVTLVRGFIACHCSPSRSGYSMSTRNLVHAATTELNANFSKLQEQFENKTRLELITMLRPRAINLFTACFKKYGYQQCINADSKMRSSGQISMCNYDHSTLLNVAKKLDGSWVITGKCPYREFDFNPVKVAQYSPGYLWCWCSNQSSTALPKPKMAMLNFLRGLSTWNFSDSGTIEVAHARMKQCARRYSYAKCVDADRSLRGTNDLKISMCRYDSETGRNVGPDFLGNNTGYITLGNCRDNNDIFVMPAVEQDQGTAAVRAKNGIFTTLSTKMNEGCVAIEHLQGAALQHADVMRPVLCYNGFCATPNHGVYFRGVYTSLKVLCNRLGDCVSSRKLVNNLKWAKNKRFVVNHDFTVTPYNTLFPWASIVMVQMIEDVVFIVLNAISLGVLTFISVLFFHKIHADDRMSKVSN